MTDATEGGTGGQDVTGRPGEGAGREGTPERSGGGHGPARAGERVRVGVVLPRPQGDPGAWLTDAVAFEAAGADALWVEHGAAPELDPLTLAAALAAVTYRTLLVVAVVPDPGRSHALATVERLSRGRLVLIGAADERDADEGVVGRTVMRLEDGGYQERSAEGSGDEGAPEDASGEGGWVGRWAPVGVPAGRAAWREVLLAAAARGDRGVLVPADPRLLDLLRNPEDPEGRHDLQLAQG
ncbi:hypothetical protein HD597_007414 [Nonomuraea thailandensis]|uniref:Luciferase-like domain-containing protein n=1 Tax=Nonomuraea thailandensis TaxID=1188745 RepID=A0A9X2GMM4_9ACTN|nr:LLM class flavin-dependent oxidoreductase [Nonomuraea thailandensis]MCP2360394.1 hypothetical protein [Nonomuraea thailandensis]